MPTFVFVKVEEELTPLMTPEMITRLLGTPAGADNCWFRGSQRPRAAEGHARRVADYVQTGTDGVGGLRAENGIGDGDGAGALDYQRAGAAGGVADGYGAGAEGGAAVEVNNAVERSAGVTQLRPAGPGVRSVEKYLAIALGCQDGATSNHVIDCQLPHRTVAEVC